MPSNSGLSRINQSGQKKKRGKKERITPFRHQTKKTQNLISVTSFCLFHAWQFPGLLAAVDFSGAFFVNLDLFDGHAALNILLNK
jgi:hypothetical protein